MFDTGEVQDTPAPSPPTQALLDDTATAMVALRAAHARLLNSVDALVAGGVAAETGHRYPSRLLVEHLRVDPSEASTLLRHAALLTPRPGLTGGPGEEA